MLIRLQKHIADLGICSRRKAEELISDGKVKVNGKLITKLGTKIDTKKDKIDVANHSQGPNIMNQGSNIYIALNKPIDYITSTSSDQGKSVIDLLTKNNNIGRQKKSINSRVYPVGRLDKDSEGLVLLTNDGELANALTHPRYEHEKEYEVTIDKPLSRDAKKVLTSGMKVDGENFQGIKIKKEFNKGRQTIVTIILKEGKNRQLRKMFGRLGYNLSSLRRIRINKLKLGTLPHGKWKFVKKDNII